MLSVNVYVMVVVTDKAEKIISVIGRGAPLCYGMTRLSRFLDIQLTDSSEVVRLMHGLLFTPRKIPGTYFF
jgi:hypothetical protein